MRAPTGTSCSSTWAATVAALEAVHPDRRLLRGAATCPARSCGEGRRVGEQDRLARAARLVDARACRHDHVGAHLGHATEGRALAAGDRDEPLDAVVDGVVDRLEGARELAARVGVVAWSRSAAARPTTPSGTARRARRGSASSPRRSCAARGPAGTPRSSGSSTTHELVPTTESARCGTTMSPSPEACRRFTTMLQSRPRTASITPGEGRIGTSTPGHARHLFRPRAGGVDHEVGADRASRGR